MRRVVVLALAIPAAVLLPLAASGQAAPKAAPAKAAPVKANPKGQADAGDRHDPDNVTGISQFMETLVQGNAKYGDKDYPGAIDLYKRAIQLNPRSPLGPYLLGEAHLAMGNLSEAEAAFRQAEERSDSKDPALRSRVLFVVADVLERQEKWEPARAAWQKYAEHAAKFADAGAFPESAKKRLEVLAATLDREKKYAEVRARIAAEKDGGADAASKK